MRRQDKSNIGGAPPADVLRIYYSVQLAVANSLPRRDKRTQGEQMEKKGRGYRPSKEGRTEQAKRGKNKKIYRGFKPVKWIDAQRDNILPAMLIISLSLDTLRGDTITVDYDSLINLFFGRDPDSSKCRQNIRELVNSWIYTLAHTYEYYDYESGYNGYYGSYLIVSDYIERKTGHKWSYMSIQLAQPFLQQFKEYQEYLSKKNKSNKNEMTSYTKLIFPVGKFYNPSNPGSLQCALKINNTVCNHNKRIYLYNLIGACTLLPDVEDIKRELHKRDSTVLKIIQQGIEMGYFTAELQDKEGNKIDIKNFEKPTNKECRTLEYLLLVLGANNDTD